MGELVMELRRVEPAERVVVGVVAPYDEVSYLTPHPEGERIRRGAFTRSISHHKGGIPLLRNHQTDRKLGHSVLLEDGDDGLVGTFKVNEGGPGDELLEELRCGYLDAMSVGFQAVRVVRGDDGVREVHEAKLVEVSMVALPAYAGAALMSVRNAQSLEQILAPFLAMPEINLDPVPPIDYRPRR